MKKIQKLCQVIGFVLLLSMSGLSTANAVYLFLWLAVSVGLLYLGKSFSFQQK